MSPTRTSHKPHHSNTFKFSTPRYAAVHKTLADLKISHKILIADLGQLEKQEQQTIALRRALYNGKKAIDVENYHTYEEVRSFFPQKFILLVADVSILSIGDGIPN